MSLRRMFLVPAMLAAMTAGAADDLKVAVVDMERVMRAYPETQAMEKLLREQVDEYEAQQKEMLAERKELIGVYRKAEESAGDSALSEAVRTEKREAAAKAEKDVLALEEKMKDLMQSRQKELTRQEVDGVKRISLKLQGVVQKYAVEKGYTLVLDSSAMGKFGFPTVLYSPQAMDITAGVLAATGGDESKITRTSDDDGTRDR